MFNLFQGLFYKPINTNPNERTIKLYFDKEKKCSFDIDINNKLTCELLHIQYHNEIGKKLVEIAIPKQVDHKTSIIVKSNFCFCIIDDYNQFTFISLKVIDIPWNYLTSPSKNLYFLNQQIPDKPNDKNINSHLNSIDWDSNLYQWGSRTQPEDYIREGQLLKYSYNHKKFVERSVMIDKDQLLIAKSEENTKIKMILLSDIVDIQKNTSNHLMNGNGKYMFEILTNKQDLIIFKGANNADTESWIDTIKTQIAIIRQNLFFIKYSREILNSSKNSYKNAMIILAKEAYTIQGILSIKETRNLFMKLLNNQLMTEIVNTIYAYKHSILEHNYLSAKIAFLTMIGIFEIKDYNPGSYFNDNSADSNTIESNSNDKTENNDGNDNKQKRISTKSHIQIDNLTEMNISLLIRRVFSYEDIMTFKHIITVLKQEKNPETHCNFLKEIFTDTLFNNLHDNITQLLNQSFKKISQTPSFTKPIQSLLYFYYQHSNNIPINNVINFDMMLLSKKE